MNLEKLAKALGISETEIEDCSIGYYGEYGLNKEQADKIANDRLEEKILERIEYLTKTVEKIVEKGV